MLKTGLPRLPSNSDLTRNVAPTKKLHVGQILKTDMDILGQRLCLCSCVVRSAEAEPFNKFQSFLATFVDVIVRSNCLVVGSLEKAVWS